MLADEVIAYRYRGDTYPPDHQLIDALIANGEASPAARDMDVEDVLDQIAAANALDRSDPDSWGSPFPEPLIRDDFDGDLPYWVEDCDPDYYGDFDRDEW